MKRRKNEAVWIEKRQYWQIKVTNDMGERRTFCSSVGMATKKGKLQAERKADEWLESSTTGGSARVETVYEKYLDHLRKTTSTGHVSKMASVGRCWVCKYAGRKRIGALTEGDCESIIAAAYKGGASRQHLKNIQQCLGGFLKFCRKNRYTTLHPEELAIPKGAPGVKRYILTSDEITTLFSSDMTIYNGKEMQDFHIHAYRFLLLSDLRPGELAGLKWSDLNGVQYSINRSINVRGEETHGKNDNARRSLVMNDYAARVIADQKEMLRKCGIISPYVFPDRHGGFCDQKILRLNWYKYCEYNGIGRRGEAKSGAPRYIQPYEFRHTCYSINKDMPETLKKMAFGHSRKFDGDTVYNHEMSGDRERIAAYSNAAFSKILEKNPPTNPPNQN